MTRVAPDSAAGSGGKQGTTFSWVSTRSSRRADGGNQSNNARAPGSEARQQAHDGESVHCTHQMPPALMISGHWSSADVFAASAAPRLTTESEHLRSEDSNPAMLPGPRPAPVQKSALISASRPAADSCARSPAVCAPGHYSTKATKPAVRVCSSRTGKGGGDDDDDDGHLPSQSSLDSMVRPVCM